MQGNPEIDEFDGTGLFFEEHIFWFDIPMDDIFRMDVSKCF